MPLAGQVEGKIKDIPGDSRCNGATIWGGGMKSVTIKNPNGDLLIKVIHHKNGEYECIRHNDLLDVTIEVRNGKNEKISWGKK